MDPFTLYPAISFANSVITFATTFLSNASITPLALLVPLFYLSLSLMDPFDFALTIEA